jgi:hypothetical protein
VMSLLRRLENVPTYIDGVRKFADFEVIDIVDDSCPYPSLLGIDWAFNNLTVVLFCLLMWLNLLSSGLTCGLRNHDSGASKLSKSPKDCTRPEPHQPLTLLDFLSLQVSNQ